MTDDRHFMPQVSDDLPAGERPMLAVIEAISGHENPLADAVAAFATAVRREQGCTEFRVFHDATKPGSFYM